MAWLMLVFLPILTYANTCVEWWEKLNMPMYSGNHVFTLKDGILTKRNYANEVLGEMELPRKIERMNEFNFEDGIVYDSNGKKYFLNPTTKKEFLLGDSSATWNMDRDGSYVFTTGKNKVIFNPKESWSYEIPEGAKYLASKNNLIIQGQDQKGQTQFQFIEKSTGKTQEVKSKFSDISSVNDNFIVTSLSYFEQAKSPSKPDEKYSSTFVKRNGKWVELDLKPTETIVHVYPDNSYLVTSYKLKAGAKGDKPEDFTPSSELKDAEGKSKKKLPYTLMVSGSQLIKVDHSPSASISNNPYESFGTASYSAQDLDSFYNDVKAGKEVKFNQPYSPNYGTNIGYGAYPGYGGRNQDKNIYQEDGKHFLKNSKGEKFVVPESLKDSMNYEILEKDEHLVVYDMDMTLIIDKAGNTKKLSRSGIYFRFDDKGRFISTPDPQLNSKVCSTLKIVEDDCNCSVKADTITDVKSIDDMTLKSACSAPVADFNWDMYTPAVSNGEISRKQALLYLNRFQKKNGMTRAHLPILVSILSSDIVEKNSVEVLEALKNLEPSLMKALFTQFNLEKRLAVSPKAGFICKTKEDEKFNLADKVSELDLSNIQGAEPYRDLLPYRYDFKNLPKEKRDALIDQVAEKISVIASQRELSSVFPSKLYYFAKKFALELFGEESKPATDISVTMNRSNPDVVILSSSPFLGNQSSREKFADIQELKPQYGFVFKHDDTISLKPGAKVGSVSQQKISWKTETGDYSADVTFKVQDSLANIIKRDPSPDYKAMKRDGSKVGLMIVGSNLAGNASLPDEYLTYYQNAGYKFEAPKSIDAMGFIREEVRSGRLDYFIKEAHSDGDEKNLVRIHNEGILLTGTKIAPNGTKEVIYILTPDIKGGGKSSLISNQDFGTWISARKKNSPLYYFNSSCSSYMKAVSELSAAASPNFVNIPTATLTYTFNNRPGNGMNVMLTSFLQEKNYEGIRKDMKEKSPRYASGDLDQFIFPDEKRYETFVMDGLKMNVDVQVQVKDSKGKVLHIDEHLDHD